jgi:ABC-type transport system, involved in lipoprotein release, permease component
MQKLTDVHLHSNFYSRLEQSGSIGRVYVYFVLALLILSIAIINFINLLTVQYEGKTKDIGVQKALGASRMAIVKQFMGKSLTFSFIALVIAAIMVELTISGFGQLVNSNLIVSYTGNPWLILLLPALAALVGIVSGIYPAFYLSRLSTIKVLKGAVNRPRGTNQFTRALVVFQFAVAMALISCITIIYMQISFMKSVDLGFHPDNVVGVSNLNRRLIGSYPAIKDALLKMPEITMVSAADHFPGGGASGQGIRVAGTDADLSINSYRVQPDYFKVLQIHLLMGRPFLQSASADSNAIILNEEAVRKLGITNPLSADILYKGRRVNVVGVVKNFYYTSLQEPIAPLVFTHESYSLSYFLVRMANGSLEKGIKDIGAVLKQFDPGYEMEYKLVDDVCRNRYNSEEQTVELTTYASLLTLLLALLGLYALTMFIVNKRTKEIGIRKVMGSTRMQVVVMLIGIFVKWITVAFIISTPLAYYIMQRWLQNYAYHISLSIWPFLMAGLVALLIAVLTVGWQAFKAASRNPIEALRYE